MGPPLEPGRAACLAPQRPRCHFSILYNRLLQSVWMRILQEAIAYLSVYDMGFVGVSQAFMGIRSLCSFPHAPQSGILSIGRDQRGARNREPDDA